MSAYLPNGSTLSIGTLGTVKTMSAISNASEAVATLEASHGVVENDIIILYSGWSRLNNRVVRADSVSTNDVTLEDIDTSSTTLYPAGSGVGTIKEVTAWTQITQILDSSFAGGEPNFTTYSYLEDDTERRLFTRNAAEGLDLTCADDPTLSWLSTVRAASVAKTVYPIRLSLSSGAVIYYAATVNFNENPSLTKDEVMGVRISLSFQAPITRYNA